MWITICLLPLVLSATDVFTAVPITSVLTPEILNQWKFSYTPFHSRIPITKTQDILNPLPIHIEFVMPSDHFKRYGALFEYLITTNSANTITIFDTDYQIHQFTNRNTSMITTQITDLQIIWTQLSNARMEDFLCIEFGVMISYHDPSLQSSSTDFYLAHYANVIFFYNPSQPATFDAVPSFFWSKDYSASRAQNATTFMDGLCIEIETFTVDTSDALFAAKPHVFMKMTADGLKDMYFTNTVEYDAKDNAYHFDQGFCIMHQSLVNVSKVHFQIIQEVDSKRLESFTYHLDEDLVLRPPRFFGSTSQLSDKEATTELRSLHDIELKTFGPYIDQAPKVMKTCVYLLYAVVTQDVDYFSQNDMFVKIVPDYDDERSVRSATVQNKYGKRATWDEQFCFDGLVKELEMHVYDVDDIGIGVSEQHIGAASKRIHQGMKQSIQITDVANAYVGVLVLDVAYLYDKTVVKAATNRTQITIAGETSIVKTCVGIIKATFNKTNDLLTRNDASVHVIPDRLPQQMLVTKTIQNSNNPEWNQVLCFIGEIHHFEFRVVDVDRLLRDRRRTFAVVAYDTESVERSDFELQLANIDVSTENVGSLWIDLFYVRRAKQPTLQPTRQPSTSLPTPLPNVALFEPDSTYMQTCIQVLHASFEEHNNATENDAFVKVIPDHDHDKSVQTDTVRNDNHPNWAQTICFKGEVQELLFNVYDVDKVMPDQHSLIGATSCLVEPRNNLWLPLTDSSEQQMITGSLYVNIYFIFVNQSQHIPSLPIPTPKPTINIMDKEYMATLSLYTDGYLSLGRGKCRDSEGRRPLYYHVKLDPFESEDMDDPHGHCRSFCSLDEDCLGYVYHISGLWKHYCALYVSVAIGDDSALYPVVQTDAWTMVSNGDMEITEIVAIEPFDDSEVETLNDKILAFCFVKTQAPPPIIKETCVDIHGFDPLVMNPPIINSAPLRAMSKPVSEEVLITLENGKGQVCWKHGIRGFQIEFSSPSGGVWFIGSKSKPIAQTQGECTVKSKSRQTAKVVSTSAAAAVYDMSYDVIVDADHYGCCYGVHYAKHEVITYSRMMSLKLSQCVLDETKSGSTYFSYNVQCDQLKSLLDHKSEFVYIGDGGCRDENNLAPSRYWHDKLEFHSCQLQCTADQSCLGIMYMFQGRWKGRCLIYTSSTRLVQLFQDGNVIPHYGWKWIEADPSPRFDVTNRKVVQTLGADGSAAGRCFAKRSLLSGESTKSFNTPIGSHPSEDQQAPDTAHPDDSEVTIRISELNQQDPLSLPWPNQGLIFDALFNSGHTLQRVCVLGQLQHSSFQSVDGEYILINKRVQHNGHSVWYNKLNGYYLYWNVEQEELQIFDDIVDNDYFAALEKEKYWKLNDGEQDIYDQFLRVIPTACPESVCITVDGIVPTAQLFPFSIQTAWIEIHGMRGYVATNKSDATRSAPQWNQTFCVQPSSISLFQLMASDIAIPDTPTTINQAVLGKFHISPLTEGGITRRIYPSKLLSESGGDASPILVQVDVRLQPWQADGFYDPNNFMMASRSIISDGSAMLRIESDRYKWIGYVGQKMTMIVHAFGTEDNNVEWYLINPGLLDIAVSDLVLPESLPGSPMTGGGYEQHNASDLIHNVMEQWTVSTANDQESDSDWHDVESVKSAAMLSVTPRKKIHYQIVVVAKEKDSHQSVSMEIEVQVLKATRLAVTVAPWEVKDDDEELNIWDGKEHGKDMWILWWVLGTVALSLVAVTVTFIMVKKKLSKPAPAPKHTGGIEMNKVDYHTVHKHTIKPTNTDQDAPGIRSHVMQEKQAINV